VSGFNCPPALAVKQAKIEAQNAEALRLKSERKIKAEERAEAIKAEKAAADEQEEEYHFQS
jgi:hypothetical protein